MYEVLGKFKICEPATRQREYSNFVGNFLSGRPVDFTDTSGFAFNGTVNEFMLDGVTFNPVYPIDRYGIQENFEFPSVGIRRKEMSWDESTHPVKINGKDNSGFDLFGTYIAVKKISTSTTITLSFSSISSIIGTIDLYNSSTGNFTFIYENLPSVYSELDSSGVERFSITSEEGWSISTYDSTLTSNSKIGTPYGQTITSLEKYKEIDVTVNSFNTLTKTISGTMPSGLSTSIIRNIQMIAPRNHTVRIIPLGGYSINNNALNIPTASSDDGMPTRASLGLSSYIYYGIPYQTNYSYSNTSRDYYVRTPVFQIDMASSDMFLFAVVVEKKTDGRLNPNGFRIGASL